MNKNLEILFESFNKQFAHLKIETIEVSECLTVNISEQSRKDWRDTIEGLGQTQKSSEAWRLLKN